MSSIAKSRRDSKGKTSKQAKAASKNRLDKLPAKGVRLARVPLSDLVGKVPSTLLNLEGWECYGHTDRPGRSGRIHLRRHGSDVSLTKACDAVELWATPVDAGDPAAYLDIHFRNAGETAEACVRVRFDQKDDDGMCLLSVRAGDMEQYASLQNRIPASIGEALLRRIFPQVPVVAGRDNGKTTDPRAEAYARLGKACSVLTTDQINLLCKHLEDAVAPDDKANGKATAAGGKAGSEVSHAA